jgi:hypothetical protein
LSSYKQRYLALARGASLLVLLAGAGALAGWWRSPTFLQEITGASLVVLGFVLLLLNREGTAARRAPDELRESESRVRSTLDNLLEGWPMESIRRKGSLYCGVEIAVTPFSASCFVVAVTDSGIGIKPEDVSRLFTKFEQLERGAAHHYGGTGLGLALTRKLVEIQGGTTSVESDVGKGSRFSVVLPLIAAGEST